MIFVIFSLKSSLYEQLPPIFSDQKPPRGVGFSPAGRLPYALFAFTFL